MTLRETRAFIALPANRGVRIKVKARDHYPRSRVVRRSTFDTLNRMSDAEFDGSCVLELGIGCYRKETPMKCAESRQNG